MPGEHGELGLQRALELVRRAMAALYAGDTPTAETLLAQAQLSLESLVSRDTGPLGWSTGLSHPVLAEVAIEITGALQRAEQALSPMEPDPSPAGPNALTGLPNRRASENHLAEGGDVVPSSIVLRLPCRPESLRELRRAVESLDRCSRP